MMKPGDLVWVQVAGFNSPHHKWEDGLGVVVDTYRGGYTPMHRRSRSDSGDTVDVLQAKDGEITTVWRGQVGTYAEWRGVWSEEAAEYIK